MIFNDKNLLFEILKYLDLYLVFNPEDLKNFFENSKNIDFKNLLIRNRSKKRRNNSSFCAGECKTGKL